MSKIIYNKKEEVKIGDSIEFNGMKIILNQQIIDDNPDMFIIAGVPKYVQIKEDLPQSGRWTTDEPGVIYEVIGISDCKTFYRVGSNFQDIGIDFRDCFAVDENAYNRQELLKKAKKKFPLGSKIKDTRGSIVIINSHNPYKSLGQFDPYGTIWFNDGDSKVYDKGEWATKLEKIFTTEDGVDLYYGDDFWWVGSNWTINEGLCQDGEIRSGIKHFSTKEAAQSYIDANKVKTLDDYELGLLIYKTPLYVELKEKEPKLYWLKILSLIAEDTNDMFNEYENREIYMDCESGFTSCFVSNLTNDDKYMLAIFTSIESANEAIKIMGDKLKFCF